MAYIVMAYIAMAVYLGPAAPHADLVQLDLPFPHPGRHISLYIGTADGMPIARGRARRHSKRTPRRGENLPTIHSLRPTLFDAYTT